MNPVPLFLIIVSLPLLLGGCGENPDGVNAEEVEDRDGITYLKGSDTPYTGKAFALYENGQKSSEVNYKDGKMDGLVMSWYENGQKRGEANFKNGKVVEGSRKYWNSKGEPVDSEEEAEK